MEGLYHHLARLSHWQIDGLALLLLLQGAVVALFPEEIIICSLGILWAQGKVNFLEALFAVQLGLLPANAILVWIGSTFGKALVNKPIFHFMIGKNKLERALAMFDHEKNSSHWIRVIVITRFTPLIRGPVYFAAGLSRIQLSKFISIDAATSFVQIPLLLVLGRQAGLNVAAFYGSYGKFAALFGCLVLMMVILRNLFQTAVVNH